jgi:hypothetical protein
MERRAQEPPPQGEDEAGGQWQGGRGADEPSQEDKIGALFSAMAANPWAYLLGIWALFVCWCLLALWGYQLYLVAIAQTTNERVRGVYHSGNNPHDRGVLRNCAAFLCAPVPPSRVPSMWRTVHVNSSSSGSGKGDSSSSSSSTDIGLPVLSDADVQREMEAAAAARAARAATAAAAKDAAIAGSSSFAGAGSLSSSSNRPCSYSAEIDPALTTFADEETAGEYPLEPVLQLQSPQQQQQQQQQAELDARQSTEQQLVSTEPLSEDVHAYASNSDLDVAEAGHAPSTAIATAEQSPTAAAAASHSAEVLPHDGNELAKPDADAADATANQRTSSGAVDSSTAPPLPDTSPVRIAADRIGALALVSGEAVP